MIIKAIVTKYKCHHCEYVWLPRFGGLPNNCPNCKTTLWNIDGLNDVKLELPDIDTIKRFEDDYGVNLEQYMKNNK